MDKARPSREVSLTEGPTAVRDSGLRRSHGLTVEERKKPVRCGWEEGGLEGRRVEASLWERSALEAPTGSQVSDLLSLQP